MNSTAMKASSEGDFLRNVMVLMSGSIAAQIIPVAISPILTRLYTPGDFGVFALYVSVILVIAVISTWRYELAVLITKKDKDSINLLTLAFILATAVSSLVLLFTILFKSNILRFYDKGLNEFIFLVPFAIFSTGCYQTMYSWYNRKKKYKKLAFNKVLQAIIAGLLSIILGIFRNHNGLIYAFFIGQLAVTLYFFIDVLPLLKKADLSFFRMRLLASRYIDFPRYQTISALIENIAGQMPVFLLAVFFNPFVVGSYALAQRIGAMPVTLIARSVADVFKQKASEQYNANGECKRIFVETLKKISYISFIPLLILLLFAPILFQFIFGPEWRIAGEYTQVMAVKFFLQLIVNPLSGMFVVAEKQRYDLGLQIYLLISTAASISIGYYYFKSALAALWLFTLVYSLKYLIEFALSYHFSKGRGPFRTMERARQ